MRGEAGLNPSRGIPVREANSAGQGLGWRLLRLLQSLLGFLPWSCEAHPGFGFSLFQLAFSGSVLFVSYLQRVVGVDETV